MFWGCCGQQTAHVCISARPGQQAVRMHTQSTPPQHKQAFSPIPSTRTQVVTGLCEALSKVQACATGVGKNNSSSSSSITQHSAQLPQKSRTLRCCCAALKETLFPWASATPLTRACAHQPTPLLPGQQACAAAAAKQLRIGATVIGKTFQLMRISAPWGSQPSRMAPVLWGSFTRVAWPPRGQRW